METITCTKCGLADDYIITERGIHKTAYCNGCGSYIKNIAYNPPTLYFGKYKGRQISSMTEKEEIKYLQWLVSQDKIQSTLKSNIDTYLKSI